MPPKNPSQDAATDSRPHQIPTSEGNSKKRKHGEEGGGSGAKRFRTATENSIIPFSELMRETEGPKHGAYLAYYKEGFYRAKEMIPIHRVTGLSHIPIDERAVPEESAEYQQVCAAMGALQPGWKKTLSKLKAINEGSRPEGNWVKLDEERASILEKDK